MLEFSSFTVLEHLAIEQSQFRAPDFSRGWSPFVLFSKENNYIWRLKWCMYIYTYIINIYIYIYYIYLYSWVAKCLEDYNKKSPKRRVYNVLWPKNCWVCDDWMLRVSLPGKNHWKPWPGVASGFWFEYWTSILAILYSSSTITTKLREGFDSPKASASRWNSRPGGTLRWGC